MASVRKREWTHKGEKRTAWVVNYSDLGGNRRQETFEKKKDADAARTRIEAEIQGGYHTAKGAGVPLSEALDAWLKDCHRRHVVGDRMTLTTIRNYEHSASGVKEALGAVSVTELTHDRIQNYVDDLSTRLGKRSVISRLHVLKRALRFAVYRKWLRRSPLDDERIRHAKLHFEEKRIPTKEEIRKLLIGLRKRDSRINGDQGSQEYRAHNHRFGIVILALFCGMRRGEIIGLQWESVDFANRIIHVRHSHSIHDGLKEPKTKAGYRQVPMSEPVVQALRFCQEMDGGRNTGYVFISRTGRPYQATTVSGITWQRLMKQSDLLDANGKGVFSFHALRHAHVSLLIEEGLSPLHVSRLIGHSDANTTMAVYAHIFPEDQRSIEAAHALAEKYAAIEFKPTPVLSKNEQQREKYHRRKAEEANNTRLLTQQQSDNSL